MELEEAQRPFTEEEIKRQEEIANEYRITLPIVQRR